MKTKMTFLTIFMMVFALFSSGQPWTEDFNNDVGSSYATGTLTLNGRDWTVKDAGNSGYANTTMNAPAITINDDKEGAYITTPALNTCGTVSFKYAYKNGSSTNVFILQKSTDGSAWTDLETKTLGASADENYEFYSYVVNDASTTLYIRILNDDQDAHLFIEDFTVTANNSSSDPILAVIPTTLTGFTYEEGSGPSAEQTFALSGANLDGTDVTVTAPTNYEISKTTGTGFANSLTYTTYDGSPQTIFVRLKSGLSIATYNGETISIAGGGDTDGAEVTPLDGEVTAVIVPVFESFDVDGNWSTGSGYIARTYTVASPLHNDSFSSNDAMRATSNISSSPYAWQLNDEVGVYLRYECEGTVSAFSINAARWDNNAKPEVTVKYSTDDGATYTTAFTFTGDDFTADKTYKNFAHTFTTPITNEAGKKIYIEFETTAGERMLYDDFDITFGEGSTDPIITATSPITGVTYYAGDNVTFTWSSANIPGDDKIKIMVDPTGTGSFEDQLNAGEEVLVSAETWTTQIPNDAATSTAYRFEFSVLDGDPAVADTIENIEVIDTITPKGTFDPVNGAVSVAIGKIITLGLTENIRKLDDSEFTDGDDVSAFITFNETDASGTSVTFTATINDKSSITITPTADLKTTQQYYVALNAGAIEDYSDNLNKLTTTTFTTETILVTGITVKGTGDATTITIDDGTLEMLVDILPANADNQEVTWSVTDGTGSASISATGLLTAMADGTVTVKATANDGSEIYGELVIIISGQVTTVAVTTINVTGTGLATTITDNAGTLQMLAEVLPANADNKEVTWSATNGTGEATISTEGLLSAIKDGTVTVKATSKDGSGIYGELVITISNQTIAVASITVTGAGSSTIIETNNGTLQMSEAVLPADATDKTVTWSVTDGTGSASISATGLLTAIADGTVTVKATANDGSAIYRELEITISNQVDITSIYDIQYTTDPSGDSPFKDMEVVSSGIVTALVKNNDDTPKGYFIQDGKGAWNGIYVYDNSNAPAVGDNITLKDTVVEYYNLTEMKSVLEFTVNSSENTLPEPELLTINNIKQEMYEGVLIKVENVICKDTSDNYGVWTITKDGVDVKVDDLMLKTDDFKPVLNATYTLTGIMHFDYGEFKIEPRNLSDVVLVSSPQLVETITVTGDGDIIIIEVDEGTLQMSAEVLPVDAVNKEVTWSVADGTGSASINATGLLIAITNGTVTVRATANDGSTIYGELEITISNQTTAIVNINKDDIKIYPNPTADFITIDTEVKVNSVQIFDQIGREVININKLSNEGINVSSLKEGIYIMKLTVNNTTINKSFVKIK